MILTFDRNKIVEIVTAVEAGTGHRVPYTGEGYDKPLDTAPGLWLVGNEGVYLLGNHEEDFELEDDLELVCTFDPKALPECLCPDSFKSLVHEAFSTLAPSSRISFHEQAGDVDIANLGAWYWLQVQFLFYQWIVYHRPELKPHDWLSISTGKGGSLFSELVALKYGWPIKDQNS